MDITQNKEVQNLPQLIEKSSTFKLIVPKKVEAKIRHLIGKYPHTEWSGVLFYSHTGNFEDNSLQLTCEDFLLMDIGSAGWTQFRMNEDVAAYMADNMELFECEIGLLHSHHSMGAFISGQDKKRLQEDGNDTNCFLSLVVDTPGNYVAVLTRKVKTKREIMVNTLSSSYEFFGEGPVNVSTDKKSETKVLESAVIECYNLVVEREVIDNPFLHLDTRISELEGQKKITVYHNLGVENNTKDWFASTYNHPVESVKQPTLFDDMEPEVTPDEVGTPSKESIDLAVSRILLCNPLYTHPYANLDKWMENMEEYYSKAFVGLSFDNWAELIIEYCVENFQDESMNFVEDTDTFYMTIAQALIDALYKYSGNTYVDTYIEKLERYIV